MLKINDVSKELLDLSDALHQRFDRIEGILVLLNSRVELLQRVLVEDINLILENRTSLEGDIVGLERNLQEVLTVFDQLDHLNKPR